MLEETVPFTLDTQKCIDVLIRIVQEYNNNSNNSSANTNYTNGMLKNALLTLSKLLTRFATTSKATLMAQLTLILPGVFEVCFLSLRTCSFVFRGAKLSVFCFFLFLSQAFKNPNADVRKAVVFLLVDLYVEFNDDFHPYLAQLSTTQQKLVQLYCKRKTKDVPSIATAHTTDGLL